MHPIKIALLGYGRMGRNHLRAIRADDRFDLAAIIDPVAIEPGADVLQRATFLRSVDAIPRVDAAIVAAPTAAHADLAARLLSSGARVLVEKPLAGSSFECQLMKDLVLLLDGAGVPRLVVGHLERFNPAVRALAKLLGEGVIGEPIHLVSTRIGGYPAAASPETNVAIDLAVHDLDILRHLLGPLRVEGAACHSTTRPGVCDTAEILLTSQRGASATVHVDWIAPTKIRTLRVTGTKGAAFLDYVAQTCAVVRGNERVEVPVERAEPLRAQLDAFHGFVTRGERGLLASAEDGAAAVLLAERALASSRGAWV
jgi:UDP-N-acetylglucosamine 3-dehydrogenase